MKKIIAISCTLCISALAFYFGSCQKSSKDSPNLPNQTTKLSIEVLGSRIPILNLSKNFNADNNFASKESPESIALHSFISELTRENLLAFTNTVKGKLINSQILPPDADEFILCTTELDICSSYDSLTSIIAFKYLPNGRIKFNVYAVNHKVITEISKYSIETDYLAVVDIYILAKKIGSNTCVFLSSPSSVKFQPFTLVGKSDALSKVLIDNNETLAGTEAYNCGVACGVAKGSCSDMAGTKSCETGTCIETNLNLIGLNNGQLNLSTRSNDDSAYMYRDGLMQQSIIGKKYISYYYKLSTFKMAFNSITASNFLTHLSLGRGLFTICYKMQYGASTEIIETTAFKNLANTLISEYKTLSANLELQSILIDIQNDLSHFENKTKAQIVAEIK